MNEARSPFPRHSADRVGRGPVLWLGFVCIPLLLALVWIEPAVLAALKKPDQTEALPRQAPALPADSHRQASPEAVVPGGDR